MQSKITLINLMAFICCASCAVPFYPFGAGAGDSRLRNSADPAKTIILQERYIFYGEEYTHVCLSDNGYVTMKAPLLSNLPRSFPITSGSYISRISKMIAPYWSDIDTRCGGNIWYRQVQLEPDHDLSRNIRREVAQSADGHDFTPKSAIIVTWAGVTPQNQVPCQDQRRNSFQLVLTSDGLRTFVLFRYKSLEWHTSRVLRPRGPATAGMNAGDRFNGFNVVNDLEDIRNLVNMTNVRSQGLFVYRIDLGPSPQIRTMLMGEMMAMSAAETMEFSTAEDELYSLHADVAVSMFSRQEQVQLEEYVGGLTAATKRVDFYPYGTEAEDDSRLGSSDEATSGREILDKPICFFGKNYSSLVVYTNGFLTLGDFYDLRTFVPRILKTSNIPIIAPYFADADTRGFRSGSIHFRQTEDSALLSRAKQDIEFVFKGTTFVPQQLYIVTWDKIGFYNHHDNLLNSYQVIIATDSHTSYIVFIYNRVEWSSPDSTGVRGMGIGAESSKLPVMGVSDGKSIERLVTGSEEPRDETKILNVEVTNGNTGIPGMWIFEASAATQTRADVQRAQPDTDPKMKYAEFHRPSRPYVSAEQQALSDVESLASELQMTVSTS